MNETKEITPQPIQRQPAKKVWIKEVLSATYVATEGWNPNMLRINDEEVTRVNILGAVVSKATTEIFNYDFFTLDDGTGRITIRSFDNKEFSKRLDVGDMVLVIGRPREYGSEVYINPELVKKIDDSAWIELRKLELAYRTPFRKANVEVEEEIRVEKESIPEELILQFIKKQDTGDGVLVEEIMERYADAQDILQKLQLQGDIFEVRPGRVKIL